MVTKTSKVYDNAIIEKSAIVSGNSEIYGNARITGSAFTYGTTVAGNVILRENAFFWGGTNTSGITVYGGDKEHNIYNNGSAASGESSLLRFEFYPDSGHRFPRT